VNAAIAGTNIAVPTGLKDTHNVDVTASQMLKALMTKESGSAMTHAIALTDPLGTISVGVGENNVDDAGGGVHTYTDFGLGFMKVQPYNNNGHNLYKPDENILRGTEMFKAALTSANGDNNPGATAAQKVWFAYIAYNTGRYRGTTVANVRMNFGTYADRADLFLDAMGVARP
jgi:hypothetical protein